MRPLSLHVERSCTSVFPMRYRASLIVSTGNSPRRRRLTLDVAGAVTDFIRAQKASKILLEMMANSTTILTNEAEPRLRGAQVSVGPSRYDLTFRPRVEEEVRMRAISL